MIDVMYEIKYRVYLEEYPEIDVVGSFKVQYWIKDECDRRLVWALVLLERPPFCFDQPIIEEEETFDLEEEEEIVLPSIEPLWIQNLRD